MSVQCDRQFADVLTGFSGYMRPDLATVTIWPAGGWDLLSAHQDDTKG